LTEREFARAVREAGGRAFIAGGWVRDRLRGAPSRDRDYVVTGLAGDVFAAVFAGAKRVGRAFPVYLLEVDGDMCEVAFARRERKTGPGYRGFEISAPPDVTIEDDLYRRDTTMNSMARSLETGELIDPWGGARDIGRRVVRATSEHFADDPVRALRAARQAARFGYAIEPETVRLMERCRGELALEPGERLTNELRGALECDAPSAFFRWLKRAGLLCAAYPQIAALVGTGGAFERAMRILDSAAAATSRTEVRFAALALGLDGTPPSREEGPRRHGHEKSAIAAIREWNALPSLWRRCAEFAIREIARVREVAEPSEIADFLERLRNHPIGPDGIAAIVRAGARKTPPFLARVPELLEATGRVKGDDIPEDLKGRARGAWLRERKTEAVAALWFGRVD
jgi:tRNA nucleotidyltransferase (CCA-adding enzyme)